MNKGITFAVVLVAMSFTGTVFAQDGGIGSAEASCGGEHGRGHGHGRGRGHGRGHGANLERMQQELSLSQDQVTRIRSLFESARAESRESRRANHEQMRARMEAILTPAQRTRAAQLRTQHQTERVEARVSRMTEHLGLSSAQATQIRAIMQAERGPEASREEREARRAQIEQVLTPEQRTRMQERGHGRGRGHGQAGEGRGRGAAAGQARKAR